MTIKKIKTLYEKPHVTLERKIKGVIAEAIVNEANLPISFEVKPTYKFEVDLNIYRKYLPDQDNHESVYLSLKTKNPYLANLVALLAVPPPKLKEAIEKEDYEVAIKLRNERSQICSTAFAKLYAELTERLF